MLHHHLFPITRDEFLKQRWREKMFVGRIMDSSKALVDSQELVEWLENIRSSMFYMVINIYRFYES